MEFRDHQVLTYFKKRFGWRSFPDLKSHAYETIVLTDARKRILWVNAGFKKMTGYTPHEAIGKKPVFLQGPLTSSMALVRFKEKLKEEKPFKSTLLNYKKDQTTYLCAIHVFPLQDKKGNTTHILALEKEA
ncbi:PAS domain-containing protein [Echinicola vietnamensis]|uniref:PAS domain S-box n=1 Tax=Echinicola vietnamensis (strain DSM 17526 / LMG 23754 / KMM 6221) TaxID=926556 RepID=L0FZR6_ECHVK|nr:PAS domain-containing protein [Echinicola vietnamensis]AGA78802.1 PAS domain S-box [Echinicola vietnamensis DSM 17526]